MSSNFSKLSSGINLPSTSAPSSPTDGDHYYDSTNGHQFRQAGVWLGFWFWNDVTGTSQSLVKNNAYVADNASLVTFTLPATAAIGDSFIIVGKGAGGWKIAQNAGQSLIRDTLTTNTGTTDGLSSGGASSCVEIVCTTANTVFTVRNSQGSVVQSNPLLFFVRSHGQTGFSSGTVTVFATSEQFNDTSWSAGTSDTTARGELQIGDSTSMSKHHVVDGRDASAAIAPNYKSSYNRTSWTSETVRTTGRVAGGISNFSGNLLVAKGTTSTNTSNAYSSSSTALDSWNGSSWSNGLATFSVAAMEVGGGNTNSKFRVVSGAGTSGGAAITNNETWNGSSTGSDTAVAAGQSIAVAQSDTNGNFVLGGYNNGINETFNGTSWTSTGSPSYTPSSSNITGAGCANGFSVHSGKSYINGGNSNSTTSLTSASVWNGSTWSSVTASSDARAGCQGSELP